MPVATIENNALEAARGCRAITDAEVAHYREHGWVKLNALLNAAAVRGLLAMAQRAMGLDGQGNPVSPMQQPFFNPEPTNGPADPLVGPLLHGVGAAGAKLMARKPGVGVRYFGDFFGAKLPAAKTTAHPGAGATYFHQDFANWAVDRSGGMTVWVALADLAPESGTMAFADGSHREGVLGHYRSYGDGDIFGDFPELADRCPLTPPLTYRAGDATVHSNLTVHGAGPNLTDGPRWAWLVALNPGDARWTGGPPEAFDTAGMTMLQPLDDARFPLLG